MRPGYVSERINFRETGESEKFRDIDLISAARFGIGDVGEPFQLGRNIGEGVELGRS